MGVVLIDGAEQVTMPLTEGRANEYSYDPSPGLYFYMFHYELYTRVYLTYSHTRSTHITLYLKHHNSHAHSLTFTHTHTHTHTHMCASARAHKHIHLHHA